MMQTSAIPVPKPSDDEEVSWALSTAAALWTRGAPADALKWLRRAAQSANDMQDDGRAVELFKLAADLASSIPPPAPSSTAAPPVSNVRPVAHALSTPPPAPAMHVSTRPSAPPRSSGVVAARTVSAPPPPPVGVVPGVLVRPSGAPPPPTGRASSSPPIEARAATPSTPPPSSRPATLLPPPMNNKAPPVMAIAPRPTPVPVIEMPTDTPLPAPRSAPPPAGPFQTTPSAPPAAFAIPPPAPESAPPPPPSADLALELEVAPEDDTDGEHAVDAEPLAPADGFHARVMIIPTSRRGELRLVLVAPGSDPPPDTLTGVLVPSAQHADTIRALLYGAG